MKDTSKPDYQGEEFSEFFPLWKKVDTCLGGTEAFRSAVEKGGESEYLPQFPLEHDDSYAYRLATSTFLPAYGDALDMIVGAITRKPPMLTMDGKKGVPASIAADWENIDNAGTHWTVFAQRLLRSGVHLGAAFVLTEMPPKPDGQLDRAQAEAINFRPFSILYSAKELADWPIYVIVDGAPILQQIRFREEVVTLDGFAEVETERYRVWRVPVEADEQGNFHRAGKAEWEIWEEQEIADQTARRRGKKKTELVIIASGVSPLADIPVAVFNANPCHDDPRETEGPVLIDLANQNIKHYQLTSDHEKILHKCTPTLTTTNLREENGLVELAGADYRLDCAEGGSADWIEPSGSSLAERREWIAAVEKQMLEMGASLFTEGSAKAAMTAEEVRQRSGAKQSRISQIAEAWKDCLETMLMHFAMWKGEAAGGEITPGVKSEDLVIPANELATVSGMVEKHQHSLKTLWAIERKLGILPDDFSDEDELAQIAKEMAMMPKPEPVIQPQPMGATA